MQHRLAAHGGRSTLTRDTSGLVDVPIELSVLVPCLNEASNIPELIARLLCTFERGEVRAEVVLVDDGSVDGTRQAIRREERDHPGVVVGCFFNETRGIAAAWRA